MRKKISKNREELDQRFQENFQTLLSESERGTVLVAAAVLEEDLEILLRKRFNMASEKPQKIIDGLFEGMGPLSSFSSKIKLAFMLDLIDKEIFDALEIKRWSELVGQVFVIYK